MQEKDERRDEAQGGEAAKASPANDPNTIEGSKRQTRRIVLWVMCGVYLIYLAFQLLRMLDSAVGSERTISIVGSVVVLIVGAALLFLAARTGIQSFKRSVQAMAAEQDALEAAEENEADEEDDEVDEAEAAEPEDDET